MTDHYHVNQRDGREYKTLVFRDTRCFFETVHNHEVRDESHHTGVH